MHRRRVLLIALLGWLCLLQVATAAEAKPADPNEVFTVVLMPDTQFYSQKYPETYVAQTMWIRERVRPDNIKFVVGLGDIVQNAHVEQEWKNANEAARILDGVVPYSMVPGNHDLVTKEMRITRDSTLYNQYFGPSRYEKEPWYGGHWGTTNDNNFCTFEAGERKFLVLSLEFCPRDEVLVWAEQVCRQHPEHNVIVATHSYLNLTGRASGPSPVADSTTNSGQEMWNKLIRKQPNIFMVACGHVGGVNLLVSTNDAGGKVIEILTDYQNLAEGGRGWLRTMRFVPAENKIYVEAYSPLLKEHNLNPKHTHTIDLDFAKLRVVRS
ncbi:MAG: metallophosphoesterase [Pirellulaceae bacterium]|nr:metallophosphoesterase [Pirellulaceae bacterium]